MFSSFLSPAPGQRRWKFLTSLSIVFTLALGIGFAVAIFSFLELFIFQPLTSFKDPNAIAWVLHAKSADAPKEWPDHQPLSREDFRILRAESQSFESIAGAQIATALLHSDRGSQSLVGEMVSDAYFEVAGASLALGRDFTLEETQIGADAPLTILSHSLWKSAFAGDPEALGRTARLNGHDFIIVGVTEEDFVGFNRLKPTDFWVPLSQFRKVFPAPQLVEQPTARFLNVFGRIEPSISRTRLDAELETLGARLPPAPGGAPDDWNLGARIMGEPTSSGLQQQVRHSGVSLLLLTLAVLLIASINIANLLAVRVRDESSENALRMALGATHRQMASRIVFTGLRLSLAGCGLGLLIAVLLRQQLWRLRPPYLDDRILHSGLSIRILAFGLGLSLLVGVLVSLGALWRIYRQQPASLLKGTPDLSLRRTIPGAIATRAPMFLQVCLSTVILGMAALFLSNLLQQQGISPGFRTQGLILASFEFQQGELDPHQIVPLQESLRQHLEKVPGIQQASIAENALLSGFRVWRQVQRSSALDRDPVMAGSSSVSEGFFQTAGIALQQGQDFTGSQAFDHGTAVINQALARQLFGNEDPIDQSLVIDGGESPYRVIGIADNTAVLTLDEEPLPFLYLPVDRFVTARFTLHASVSDKKAAGKKVTVAEVREALRQHEATFQPTTVVSIEQVLAQALWMERLSTTLLSVLGLVALALAGLGIYSLAMGEVRRKKREIGIRLALGAPRRQVLLATAIHGMTVVVAGALLGVGLLLWVERLLEALLHGSGQTSILALALVPLALVLLGLAGHARPLLSAIHIDPWETLRES